MKIFFTIFIISLFVFTINTFSQSGTFDFETANGASSSGSPLSVTQSRGAPARIVTVSSSGDVDLYDASSYVSGISGNSATCFAQVNSILITFSGAVNIRTLRAYESSSQTGSLSFSPTGGTNSAVNNQQIVANASKVITLNWVGITSISVTATASSYWGFDDIVMDATLPVELTSFTGTAYGSIVALDWATATEVNNYGFNVERRVNNEEWQKISFVQGHGNSNSPKIYSFQDWNPPVGKVQYRLKQIDFSGVFDYSPIVEVNVEAPSQLKLAQNYPNPFNPETTINYQIPFASHVTLKVYDVLGIVVATLVDEFKQPGVYNSTFNTLHSSLASGVYFYNLQTNNGFSETKKLMIIK